ncbi:hypothetical protein Q1695_013604 [Nippostrongylus brasiliensis]|nr:hypothetical protein Q1695_013604 [Nippostrongylus brasiliensis]
MFLVNAEDHLQFIPTGFNVFRFDRRSSAVHDRSITTAPDYSVEEDEFGRLINREKLMIWPERKPRAKSEFERLIRSAPDKVPLVSPAPSTSSDVFMATPRPSSSVLIYRRPEPELEETFIGGASPKEAAAKVDPSSFVLYYRIDEPLRDRAYLYMAYKSSLGRSYHFPLTCRKVKVDDKTEATYWRVEYGDPDPMEFPCLSALVRYHRVFSYYDMKSGAIEAFPLWSGDRVVVE